MFDSQPEITDGSSLDRFGPAYQIRHPPIMAKTDERVFHALLRRKWFLAIKQLLDLKHDRLLMQPRRQVQQVWPFEVETCSF
jgi:hypothetical protein